MRKYIIALAGTGLLAGAVLAPAQAEEEEPLPVLPCVDFQTEFTEEMSSPFGEIVEQNSEGAVFTGTIEAESDDMSGDVALPPLSVYMPEPTEWVPSVDDGVTLVFGCDHHSPLALNYAWLSRSDGIAVKVDKIVGVYGECGSYLPEGADGCEYLQVNSSYPDSLGRMLLSPAVTIEGYGQYVNVAKFWMSYEVPGSTQWQKKTTEVSYTLNVLPPGGISNDLPELPNEPLGISDGHDFGKVEIFDYKRGVVKITNIGTEGLAIRRAQIVDADGNEAPEFAVTGTDCKDGFIAPKRSCEVEVQFFPREQGARAAFINVATNSAFPLQIPLNGVGTYTKPESIEDAEQEAEETGEPPTFEVGEPEAITVPGNQGQEATKKNGKWEVKTKKKKIKVKWKAPDTDQPVTGYEIRKKFKKKKWKNWKDVDPMPNKKGWIKASVKAKKPGNYKIQVTSSTPWVERGDKATVKITKK